MDVGQVALGRWVRILRTRMGLRQHEFARALHVHWTTVSRWERGVSLPRPAQVEAAASLYLAHVSDPGRWSRQEPGSFHRNLRTMCIMDTGSPQLGTYLREGVRSGKKLVVIHEGTAEGLDALIELTAGTWTGDPACLTGQLSFIPSQAVFAPTRGALDPSDVLSRGLVLETRARDAGFSAVWWLADFRPVLPLLRSTTEILALEHAMDAAMRSRRGSHAFALFPRSSLDERTRACLLCLTPQVATEHGLMENPFYSDPNLCLAVRMSQGSHEPAEVGCRGIT